MSRITKEEVIKLASISHLLIDEADIPRIMNDLNEILAYTSCLKDVAQGKQKHALPQNVNVVREDLVIPTSEELILSQAPERQENFFVVPVILKQT